MDALQGNEPMQPAEGSRMKVVSDSEVCQACGACARASPEVFSVEFTVVILNDSPASNLLPQVVVAVDSCPTGAIWLDES
jgi:ferredoxin